MNRLRLFVILTLFFLSINFVLSSCDSGQVDINTASLEELDGITHVGPAIGQRIIDGRPFENLDQLVEVSGISEGYVEDIKSQGLACVEETNTETVEETTSTEKNITENIEPVSDSNQQEPSITELNVINLNPKAIKSDSDSSVSDSNRSALYGLFGFGVLLGLLFLIQDINKRRKQNEFT